jgi:hypothetical protein
MISRGRALPTPHEMIELGASELAILAALDTTLEATVSAMLIANPEVLNGDPYDECESQSPAVWIAEAFVNEARTLRAIIDRYRHAIYMANERVRDDQDIDF